MTIFKFTEARIGELPLGSGIHRDTDVKGLLCICHKTTKTYCAQGDVRREKRLIRSVRAKIGRTDFVRLADARSEAKRLMATIQSGVDPTAGVASTGITLEKVLAEHLKERNLSAVTVKGYAYHMDHYLKGLRKRAVELPYNRQSQLEAKRLSGLMVQLGFQHRKSLRFGQQVLTGYIIGDDPTNA